MPNMKPKSREDLAELEDVFKRAEMAMGFIPSSFFMMGRKPNILRAFSQLSREVLGVPGAVPQSLKWLVAHVASRSAGCQYCTAHSGAAAAGKYDVPPEKVAAAFEYETNPMFSAAERAALSFAQSAGTQPNMVSRADFDEMLKGISTRIRSSRSPRSSACSAGSTAGTTLWRRRWRWSRRNLARLIWRPAGMSAATPTEPDSD